MPHLKNYQFELNPIVFKGQKVSIPCLEVVSEGLKKGVADMYDKIAAGDAESIQKMPPEASLPMVLLKHLFQGAVDHDISAQAIEFGFDPDVFFEGLRGEASDEKAKLQKPIKTEFSKPEKGAPPAFISLIIDDNALNSLPLEIATIDRSFSVKDLISLDQRMQTLRQYMTMDKLRDAGW